MKQKLITLNGEIQIPIQRSDYLKDAITTAKTANNNNDGKTVILILDKIKTIYNLTRNEVLELFDISTTRLDKLREIRLSQEKIEAKLRK